jgi:2-succinyl-6-hydroxy-2,4-cyclohexadiene-1-carboxylate synthase
VLHVRRFGSGPEIVALHGFSLTGEQFAPGAGFLDRTIVAPDLPGHGSSRAQPSDIDRALGSIEALFAAQGGPRPLIGYSQGARLALLAVVEDPVEISALVLVSGTAGIQDPDERQSRREQDHVLAERIEAIGLDAFIDSWTSKGITSVTHLSDDFRTWDRGVRSQNSASGLSAALRGYGQGAQPCVWSDLERITIPVLLISGSRDARYTAINNAMADLIPEAELIVIDDAGHNPLADEPAATYGAVSDFIDRHS